MTNTELLEKARNYLLEEKRWLEVTGRSRELEALYGEVKKKTLRMGFDVEFPPLMVMGWGWFMLLNENPNFLKDAVAVFSHAEPFFKHEEESVIIFIREAFRFFRDEKLFLEYVLAHEVGHLVDFRYKGRKGHPFFKDVRNYDRERLADAFVAYLYGTKAVDLMNETVNQWRM